MKKIILGIVFTLIICSLIIPSNHLQQPTEKDVLYLTKNWSESVEEVYFINEIDERWLTIFRTSQSTSVAELKQNWFGTWILSDGNTLSSTYYPPLEDDQITWSASGKSKENISYYFGEVIDPEIVKITVETQRGIFENVPFIESAGQRFFLKRAEGSIFLPVNICGFSNSGELIYSSVKKIPFK
ncbi:hypothetical protein ACIP9C_12790 [Lysinibacillus sp. NPDC093210]|uniref:hypothetical protein n=1 Tax=Lysinibacillus sp. NPDC093210 TaxID=3364133 RepID=UPI00380F623C